MRPAQLTPENLCQISKPIAKKPRFNEAGAINAGKLHRLYLFETKRQISGGFEHHPKFDELHVSNINFL